MTDRHLPPHVRKEMEKNRRLAKNACGICGLPVRGIPLFTGRLCPGHTGYNRGFLDKKFNPKKHIGSFQTSREMENFGGNGKLRLGSRLNGTYRKEDPRYCPSCGNRRNKCRCRRGFFW